MQLSERVGLKMVEWTASVTDTSDELVYRCKRYPACYARLIFKFKKSSLELMHVNLRHNHIPDWYE
jgi:hypothetical protein